MTRSSSWSSASTSRTTKSCSRAAMASTRSRAVHPRLVGADRRPLALHARHRHADRRRLVAEIGDITAFKPPSSSPATSASFHQSTHREPSAAKARSRKPAARTPAGARRRTPRSDDTQPHGAVGPLGRTVPTRRRPQLPRPARAAVQRLPSRAGPPDPRAIQLTDREQRLPPDGHRLTSRERSLSADE